MPSIIFRHDDGTEDVLWEVPHESGYRCEGCDSFSYDTAGSPLYECGECGTRFNRDASPTGNHRCPDCNRFGSKVAEDSCAECGEGEVSPVEGFICPSCGEVVPHDEAADHLTGCLA